MIEYFINNKKFFEYFKKSFESKTALISSLVILGIAWIFDIYNNFGDFIDMIDTFLSSLAGAFIGLLALILSGIALYGTLFDEKYANRINALSEDRDAVSKLFCSFVFLAFNVLCSVIITIIILIMIHCRAPIVCMPVFYLIVFTYVYYLVFSIAYVVAMIKNTVDLIILRIEVFGTTKTIFERANEVRIEWLMKKILEKETIFVHGAKENQEAYITNELNKLIDMQIIDENEKKQLREYFDKYYNCN